MPVRVYVDLMSQPARAVYIFCKATGIPHQIIPLRIVNGDTRTEEYTAMNPFQRVPVVQDGDFALTESVAIFRYLAQTRAVADHWYPQDHKLQARVDEYLEWQHQGTRLQCSTFFQEKWLFPIAFRQPPNEKRIASTRVSMEKCLEELERIWLQDGQRPYLCGDTISCADILAACELEQPAMAGYDVREKSAILKAYMDRVKAKLNPYYDEAHAVVYKVTNKFKGLVPTSAYQGKAKL